ncbi:MAG: hypothetical protein M9907_08675 [Burkholderiaceae bacterium]|nr:hypothetical protein [Burkholderiaceae bacterium]
MDPVAARAALADELERFLAYCSENPDDRAAQRQGRSWTFGACRAAVAVGLMTEAEAEAWVQRAWLVAGRSGRPAQGAAR